jgi:hypothetical protein
MLVAKAREAAGMGIQVMGSIGDQAPGVAVVALSFAAAD